MSSEVLLTEIEDNLKNIKNFSELSKLDENGLKKVIIEETVKLSSLKRQSELIAKLNSDFPGRISEIGNKLDNLNINSNNLKNEEIERERRIEGVRARERELEKQFETVLNLIDNFKINEKLNEIQKFKIYEIISKIYEINKNRKIEFKSEKEENDFNFLSFQISQNDDKIRKISKIINKIENRL
jgi:hypothetical protein